MKNLSSYIGTAVVAAVAMLCLSIVLGSWYTVDQGERGVVLRNGAVSHIAQPGLSFKLPFFDRVEKLSVQTHVESFNDMHTYSKDQQPSTLRLSVNYRVATDQVGKVYEVYGSLDNMVARLIRPHVHQMMKVVFGGYTAVMAIQNRGQLNTEVAAAIQKSVDGPIIVESVQIENIDFSKAYEQSIEARMLAEVEVQKMRQNAEREKVQAQIVETQAQGKANAVRAQAQAEADAIRLRGEAEAKAISARATALGSNPNLVSLVQAEKWDGRLPSTMLPNGAVPMLTGVGRSTTPQ